MDLGNSLQAGWLDPAAEKSNQNLVQRHTAIKGQGRQKGADTEEAGPVRREEAALIAFGNARQLPGSLSSADSDSVGPGGPEESTFLTSSQGTLCSPENKDSKESYEKQLQYLSVLERKFYIPNWPVQGTGKWTRICMR